MTTQIRPATERDAPLILDMIKGLAEYEKLAHAVTSTEETVRASLFGDHPAAQVVIATVDGAPAGFALFFHNYSTFLAQPGLYLEDLFVKPTYRGHGVGRALLEHLAGIAVDRNCGRFEWSVLDWNEPAIGFYKRLGAVPLEDWTIFRVTGAALKRLAGK